MIWQPKKAPLAAHQSKERVRLSTDSKMGQLCDELYKRLLIMGKGMQIHS